MPRAFQVGDAVPTLSQQTEVLDSFRGHRRCGCAAKPQSLIVPASGSGVRGWNRAVEIIRDMELPSPIEPTLKPQVDMEAAIASFLAFKSRRSLDVQRKSKLNLGRLKTFLEKRKKVRRSRGDIHRTG